MPCITLCSGHVPDHAPQAQGLHSDSAGRTRRPPGRPSQSRSVIVPRNRRLAPEPAPLTPAERLEALDSALPRIRQAHRATPAARIGLVAADRPADVLAVIGWGGLDNRAESLLPLTAVLRSWEDRFGAAYRCRLRRSAAAGGAPAAHAAGSPAHRRRASRARSRLRRRDEGHPQHGGPPGKRPHLDLLVGLNQRRETATRGGERAFRREAG